MIFRLGALLGGIGIVLCFAAIPVSIYVNGDAIYTEAGNVAGNKCMMIGQFTALTGMPIILLSMVFDRGD